jgi:hypothetical protein
MRLEISLAPNNQFTLHLPSPLPGRSHEVTLPFSEAGLATLRRLLREHHNRERLDKIGHLSSPTQYQVDEWLRARALEVALKEARSQEQIQQDHPLISFEGL